MTCTLALLALFGPLDLMPDGKKPADRRLATVRSLNDRDFFLKVPPTLAAWKKRAAAVREQILISQGLWPMPARPAIKATIHGKVERDGYTIEKVFFASTPGHYVTGSLYRPTVKKNRYPAVLAAHGHWKDGRKHDAGEAEARHQVKIKAESDEAVARHMLQAICVQLARMGCVVFFYDMIGYADSTALGHGAFAGTEAELHLVNLMGLQTLNSLRALDFVTGLPDVDTSRIGMTGGSGGGTQTFILGAIDERITAALPAVMVSTGMQGGCVCENASLLRVGTGNVEFAAMMAPRPLAMTAANDWTLEIEKKGLPEIKGVYKLFGQPERVRARTWAHFTHNYNQPAREYMYDFFNEHLALGQKSPIRENLFKPETPASLGVFTRQHPLPADSLPAGRLIEKLVVASSNEIDRRLPRDADSLEEYRKLTRPALRVMLGTEVAEGKEIEWKAAGMLEIDRAKGYLIGRRGQGEQVPAVVLRGEKFDGTVIVWVIPEGKAGLLKDGKPSPAIKAALDAGAAVVGVDVFGTGELAMDRPHGVNARMAGYTFGYNRTVLGQRCHDILTAISFARAALPGVKRVHLAGAGKAGPWVMLARGLAGDAVTRTAADVTRFRFESVKSADDEMMLPGALKYAGLGGLASLAAPHEVYLHNHQGSGIGKWTKATYKAADAPKALESHADRKSASDVMAWLLR